MSRSGYSLMELVRAAGVTERTVRYYVERRVMPGPELRGLHTTYTDEHLLRLRVIRHLREVERLRLEVIRKRIAGLSAAELRALLPPGERGPEPEQKALQPAAPAASPQASAPAAGATQGRAPAAGATPYPAERWERIVLVPGLEIHVRADCGPLLQRLAREIHAQYGVGAPAAADPVG